MLALTTKYALSALHELALVPSGEYLQIQALSRRAEVPGPYLSKVMKTLVAKRLIESKKGLNGGVRLAAGSRGLCYKDVCIALEDPVVSKKCFLSKKSCRDSAPCIIHDEWRKMRASISDFLEQSIIKK